MTDTAPLPHATLLTPEEVAAVLRISLRTVRRFIASGHLPAVRFGRSVRIRPTDLDQYLRSDTK